MRDFILNKRYLSKDDDNDDDDSSESESDEEKKKDPKSNGTSSRSVGKVESLDAVDLSDEEKIVENQEEFERKYNFRFEEPDPEFIKSYPRTVADSMRRDKSKRKEKRDEYKKRKEEEKQRKKEELKRLKNLKRKEIMDKLDKIKKITGNEHISLNIEDLERDFDADEYERKMQEIFNDDYYQKPVEEERVDEDGKPIFSDDELINEIDYDDDDCNWDEWPVTRGDDKKEKKKKKKKSKESSDDETKDPEFEVISRFSLSFLCFFFSFNYSKTNNNEKKQMDYDKIKEKRAAKDPAKQKALLAKALLREKPVFDPSSSFFLLALFTFMVLFKWLAFLYLKTRRASKSTLMSTTSSIVRM